MAPRIPARKNDDDSVDVWVAGWCVRFPADGEPTATKAEPPNPVGTVPDVKVAANGDATEVRYGDSLVTLFSDEYEVGPTKPTRGWRGGHFLYKIFR